MSFLLTLFNPSQVNNVTNRRDNDTAPRKTPRRQHKKTLKNRDVTVKIPKIIILWHVVCVYCR